MREIYNRDPSDVKYDPYILEVSDPIEVCVGQLKMMLLTNKGEVLGDPRFGLNLEDLIFNLQLSEASIKKELDLHLRIYVPLFQILGGTYKIQFFVGTQRDIATLDFQIPQDGGLSPVVSLRIT
jgi:hypothetical protein